MYFSKTAAALAALLPLATAQTYTDCDPLNKTCPADTALSSTTFTTDFTSGSFSGWIATANNVTFTDEGANFIISKEGEAPTIETDFYFFFGKAEVVMKAANGTGICSSIVLESDDLDEIDWEALGGDTTQIETNYFGKGDTSSYDRATWATVSTPQDTFHTYTVEWTKSATTWSIDGTVVRTLDYSDAESGTRYPQTPMRLKLGIWAAGDSSEPEGTIEWAGGETDYADGPFTMTVQSVSITNYNPGSSYTYSDKSGDYTSIVVNNGTSSSTTGSTTSSSSASTSTSSTSSNSGSGSGSSTSSESSTSASSAAAAGSSTALIGSGSSSGSSASASGSASASSSASASASPVYTGAATQVGASTSLLFAGLLAALL
ncbi:concanavalin A-like lectin/glucanase [Aspergillus eucalypticola CBS 122712]|uniref:Crh-like protein n=1 Tax=Aspergillus eucalypticola (strain CBS 122712 / IBT 29274) TaxID=1448314 RepID=A0A317WC87_ASPEC|nr:concanavalin A-like lectin/glucanase [Aspergillus eucalypticola CBS 122712]PWY83983.1 concanavalin A-like lectin/glucanase [Aspergillus eucalypticola CBS 122712]